MSFIRFTFLLSVLVHYSIPLGSCTNYNFSICWWMKNNTSFDRLQLNDTELMSIGKQGKFTSLSIATSVEHVLKLQYGKLALTWKFSVIPDSNSIQVRSQYKPMEEPNSTTLDTLQAFLPNQVFACENRTLYLHQDVDFVLALGHTARLPLKLESRSTSMLLVSWSEEEVSTSITPPAPPPTLLHAVSLYHTEMEAFTALRADSTATPHYRFTGLDSCTRYAACVERAGGPSVVCLSTSTDPDAPRNSQVTSWNSSSVTVAWNCPQNRKFSLFLVTVLHLNGSDHVVEERSYRHRQDSFVFTEADLAPCSRVKFGLQTVCEFGTESRRSRMVMVDGNSAYSEIENLHQSDFGAENYTLSWMVKNISSIAVFRVYHEGVLHGSTFLTTHTVTELQPCQRYVAKVEAVCGESVVMSVKAIRAHTAPRGVLDLRYRPEEPAALWRAGTGPAVAFQYVLSYESGEVIERGRLPEPVLALPGLRAGQPYVLDVWAECEGLWSTDSAQLCFTRENASHTTQALPDLELEFDFSSPALDVIVPWKLSVDLQDPKAAPRVELERIVKQKLEELLEGFPRPANVKLFAFEDFGSGAQTKISFQAFDASISDAEVPLSPEQQLGHIQSLRPTNITVRDGMIYWADPDECATADLTECAPHSLCINTLDSFTCVCQGGYYDISPLFSSSLACHEKGMFTRCLRRGLEGGVAKAFLVGYFGGTVSVVLNDGRCPVVESKTLYYFQTSRHPSHCGTQRLVNRTHVEFRNTLTVTLTRDRTITRRDLKVVWKCVYPRNYLRSAQVNVGLDWITSYTVVEYNSSHVLQVAMTLYSDDSFTYSYTDAATLDLTDLLFFEVALQSHNSFASDLLLEVASCWATESPDPQHHQKGFLLRDGCPVDRTFHWLLENGATQKSRFSVQMFTMPAELPIYMHCLVRICSPDENCTTSCLAKQYTKVRRDLHTKLAAVVSAGPLIVDFKAAAESSLSKWQEVITLVAVLGGTIGLLVLTVFVVSTAKALMTCYQRPE